MTDTVTRLMGLADEYRDAGPHPFNASKIARQALQDELTRLFTKAQFREALAQQEAVTRMALKALKNSNAVSFDDLHAIKALEEQLK